ncbi:MAG: hydroxymethylbilane synthase [Rhizobiales bacterium]|nr:hydroxymethylbilane synthase [Hyphomicrobiales bacterium]
MAQSPIRIATRGSPLALAQARLVARLLCERHDLAPETVEILKITTSGDAIRDRRLSDIGGKGLFTKEISEALIEGSADLAVHSMKDVETRLPEGLEIAALLEREDPRDVLIANNGARAIADLPKSSILGTASLRRGALVKALRPDIQIETLRGNVQTRLAKLEAGSVDATLLAKAGLNRLGLEPANSSAIEPAEMLPAVAQGAIGIEIRKSDERLRALITPLDHAPTRQAVTAERALLAALDGSCRTPIAALATTNGEVLHLNALIAKPDGSAVHRAQSHGAPEDAQSLGHSLGEELKQLAGPGFLDG